MLYLAFIWHMHQPYYKDIETGELLLPWVRLHGIKDYLDMVQILSDYPKIKQVFNFVPSLVDQIQDYAVNNVSDRFLRLSYKKAEELSGEEQDFLLQNFFMADMERIIALHPRYYELFLKKNQKQKFSIQDFRDLQLWFNLAWFDPSFRNNIPQLRDLNFKGRFFNEEDKAVVLKIQFDILRQIIPAYQQFIKSGQIEVTTTPYYHPILPLLYDTKIAKETIYKMTLPAKRFVFPQDAKWQVEAAVSHSRDNFGIAPEGMWPAEEAVSEHIVPLIINSGIKWIVCDEAILFKSLRKKKRDPELLYQPFCLKREEGTLNVVFRDRNLSDLIGFVYHRWQAEAAVDNLMGHLLNIAKLFRDRDCLVTIAMDGENAWEYYPKDGAEFLGLLYQRISEADWVRTETIKGYLATHQPTENIKRLAAGSWIYGDFNKWIGNPAKNRAWDYLTEAREALEKKFASLDQATQEKAMRQVYIAEGSDWFWWYGEDPGQFDVLFRKHLANLYRIIGENPPAYLAHPI
jgi:alpha-amylase/alpha-mannosidase (GH57 family)